MADWLGEVIGWVSPRAAYNRRAWRMASSALAQHDRAYQAAERSRLSADRFTMGGSFDAAVASDLDEMRRRSRQSFRDNPLMKSAVVNLLAWMIGDGIEIRPVHPDPKVAKRARDIWREAARARVWGDGQDFYGSQVLRAAEMIKGGESVAIWMPEGRIPDARLALYQGDYIDTAKNELLPTGGRIALGVEYDRAGVEVATWLYETHPGDLLAPFSLKSVRVPASRYSRLFWRTDIGQSRGVPWDHAGQTKLGDVEALKEAIRTKKRVEACVALLIRRDVGDQPAPLGAQVKGADGSTETTMRPGMIADIGPAGGIEVVNPSSSGEADEFHRAEVRDFCAAIGVPYFIATGDVSDANYTTLRADILAFYKRLDLWQQHTLEPAFAADFHRVMRREALRRGDLALLKVSGEAVMPDRPHVDPLKDGLSEKVDVRGGFASMPTQLARRGIDWMDHVEEVAEFNAYCVENGVVFDTNPALVSNTGAQQPGSFDSDRSDQLERLAYQLLED